MRKRSPQTTYTICHLCNETIQLNLLQNHLKVEHGLTYIEYKEKQKKQKQLQKQ